MASLRAVTFKPRQCLQILCQHYHSQKTASGELPRITIPHKLARKIQKVKLRKIKDNVAKKPVNYKLPLMISCKRSTFNFRQGQKFNEFEPKVLASAGWKHRKSTGDYFTINGHKTNPAFLDKSDKRNKQFDELGLSPQIVSQLEELNIHTPTNIQRLTIPQMMKGNNIICTAETGCGKTLAYLLPILELMSKQKQVEPEIVAELKNSPRAIIIAPAKELVDQIKSVADAFSSACNLTVKSFVGGPGTKKMLAYQGKDSMDLLICTPGVLLKLLASKVIFPSRLQHLILDESDTLFDDSFSNIIGSIINIAGVHGGRPSASESFVSTGTQMCLVSATKPRDLGNILGNKLSYESFKDISTENIHRLLPHISQKFLRLNGISKPVEILKIAKQNSSTDIPTMIFCNSSETSYWLSNYLEENNVKNILFNGKVLPKMRVNRFDDFQREIKEILVCTDIASRGLDTLRVRHVVNYDFPDFMSDYVHRAGRVGRVGSVGKGIVTSFISAPWEVDLLWQIETAARKSGELKNVNANIKRKLTSIIMGKYGDQE